MANKIKPLENLWLLKNFSAEMMTAEIYFTSDICSTPDMLYDITYQIWLCENYTKHCKIGVWL